MEAAGRLASAGVRPQGQTWQEQEPQPQPPEPIDTGTLSGLPAGVAFPLLMVVIVVSSLCVSPLPQSGHSAGSLALEKGRRSSKIVSQLLH